MDSFIDWPRIMFSLSNARSSSGNGEPTGDNGQDVSHANLWHEPWDGPSWSAGPPTTSGFELASFQSAYEHIPNLSQNADDEVRASDAWHRVRSQATSFTPAAYPYTRRLFRNTSTTAAESSPSRELSPQAFHRRFGITTLANSTSVGNISPKEPSATKGSSEETETPSVSPTLPQTNKENADVAHRSKPSTSIPLEDKSEKQPLAGPSKPDIPRKVTRSQQPRPSKRRRKEDDKAPASIGGSSRLRGVSPVQRTTRIRVPGGRRLTALATAGQIDLSGAPPLFPPPSSSSTPTPVAGPSSAPTLSAGKIHGQSVRVRRTKAELEQRAAPKVKRCGILNCSEDIGATPADANKHIKAHYERAAALLAAGVTMAGVAEDVARSSTSSGAQPEAGSDAEPETAESGPHEEADELAATVSVARWEGRYSCWYQETAASLMCYEITGKSYAGVYELQRHCKDKHHLWFFECQKCRRRFKRREEFRTHDLGCRYGG